MLYALSVILFLSTQSPDTDWRSYEVYEPVVERCFIVNPAEQKLKYNHVSSIAWFKGTWFCVWNGNTIPAEGKPGQLNYMSTSDAPACSGDKMNWTQPEPAFADAARSHNPIPCLEGYQWQPNLAVVDDELWAFWNQNSKDEYAGCYFSRLDEPDGKWCNRLLRWNGATSAKDEVPKATLEGKAYRLFPSQNACILRSGRILQPVTLMGSKAADAPEDLEGWWTNEKRNSVIYSDDKGETWHVSHGAILPGQSWAQWEPVVWEQPDGSLMMFSRNNDPRTGEEGGPSPAQRLLWSRSEDAGLTWTPHQPVALETIVSRPYVMPIGGNRFLMAHNDWHSGRFASDRMNLALFFTRGEGLDFVAGPGFTGHEQVVAYPQMFLHDDTLVVSYTQGTALRGIKAACIRPLPDPDRFYLFPRTNRPSMGPPTQKNDTFLFQGREYLETSEPIELGEQPFSLAARICTIERGVLLDTRSDGGTFVWGLTSSDTEGGGVIPFIHANTPEGNIKSSLIVPFGEWACCGVTVDFNEGHVVFAVNGKSELIDIMPVKKLLRSGTGYVGFKRFESSALTGFTGSMRSMALFNIKMTEQEHAHLADLLEQGKPEPPRIRDHEPSLWLTAARPVSVQPFTAGKSSAFTRVIRSKEGARLLEIFGDASAGVDLDYNNRQQGDVVHLHFRARIDRGSDVVVCSVGDANTPCRIVVRKGIARLEMSGKSYELGRIDGHWFTVIIQSGNDFTSACVDSNSRVELPHKPQANWVYLGDGYPSGETNANNRLLIEVASVQSYIER